MIHKSHRWQKTALAAATVAVMGLTGTQALALSLGRISVQSALGEPLRAEIDIPEINAEESNSLRAAIAAPEAFTAANMEYGPAMSGLQLSVQRRADGRAYIRVSGDKTINEPFMDMIVIATWSSGRIVRDYTLLFDPPALRTPTPAPTLAQTTPVVPAATPAAPAATPTQATTTTPASTSEPPPAPATAAKPGKASAPLAIAKPAKSDGKAMQGKPASVAGDKVTVKDGDTASKIAHRTKSADVSLDQMLVAMLRANPAAFVNEDVNRLRSGAVLDVPSAEQAKALSAAEATKVLVAHSKDFNALRRNMASNTPVAPVAAADRKASGTVQAKVEDKKPASTKPDKLTLSKGSVTSKAEEAKIAKERADKEAKDRAAELAKNIADLKAAKAAAATPAPAPVAAPAAPAPAAPVAATPAAPSAPAAAPASPEAAAPATPAVPAPAVATPPVKPQTPPAAAPVEPPSALDELLEDPAPLAAAGAALLALIGGFAFWWKRRGKQTNAQMDSSFLESRLQPDSFFGASGGQRVDTNDEGQMSGSSMAYSPSQLDAADDVDPVAEADVYMAYGRDLQAEEILKEALRTNPGRLAIHTKLLEIFAKRRDTKGYEATATQAFKLTGANSPDWERICSAGLSIDPENSLYQSGGAPSASAPADEVASSAPSAFNSTIAQSAHAAIDSGAPSGVDLDLDLDFSIDDEPVSAISDVTGGNLSQTGAGQTVKMEAVDTNAPLEMDFDIPLDPPQAAEAPSSEELPEISHSMDGVSLTSPDESPSLTFESTGTMPVEAAAPAPTKDSGMLEFDLGSLSLDLESSSGELTDAPDSAQGDPLETKLSLAEEFVSIGDEDGARALIEEVIAEASGDMRAKAQRALANLR